MINYIKPIPYLLVACFLIACGGAPGAEEVPEPTVEALPTLAGETPATEPEGDPGDVIDEDEGTDGAATEGNASPRQSESTFDDIPPTYTPASQSVIILDSSAVTPEPSTSSSSESVAGEGPSVERDVTGQTYTVQRGDTLAEIAESFSVSLDSLFEANRDIIDDIDVIEVDQVLRIPEK